MPDPSLEVGAQTPIPVSAVGFNRECIIPYGLSVEHIRHAMDDFVDFLGFVNQQLGSRNTPRLESMLMPANFSSMVGEYLITAIPKFCPSMVKNLFHNGHPDLIPADTFDGNQVQYSTVGIEVKSSRYDKGWQGHNPEACWLMVFVFDANSANDVAKGLPPKPFRFRKVVGAQLELDDWKFSGRSETSRRTITSSVLRSGYDKMEANWIYRNPVENAQ